MKLLMICFAIYLLSYLYEEKSNYILAKNLAEYLFQHHEIDRFSLEFAHEFIYQTNELKDLLVGRVQEIRQYRDCVKEQEEIIKVIKFGFFQNRKSSPIKRDVQNQFESFAGRSKVYNSLSSANQFIYVKLRENQQSFQKNGSQSNISTIIPKKSIITQGSSGRHNESKSGQNSQRTVIQAFMRSFIKDSYTKSDLLFEGVDASDYIEKSKNLNLSIKKENQEYQRTVKYIKQKRSLHLGSRLKEKSQNEISEFTISTGLQNSSVEQSFKASNHIYRPASFSRHYRVLSQEQVRRKSFH